MLQYSHRSVAARTGWGPVMKLENTSRKTPRSARNFSTKLDQDRLLFIQPEWPKPIPNACRFRALDNAGPGSCYRCSAYPILQEVFLCRPSRYQLRGTWQYRAFGHRFLKPHLAMPPFRKP